MKRPTTADLPPINFDDFHNHATAELQQANKPISFCQLIEQLEDGWIIHKKTGVHIRSPLPAGQLAEMLHERKYLLRFNELTMFCEVLTATGWVAIVDADMDSAYVLLSMKGWSIGVVPITKAVCHLARLHRFHPVKQYLLALEVNPKVLPFDLDQVSPKFFRASQPLHVAMVRKWLIGAVARAMEPGCQMDYCLVLQSRQQGLKKSTSLRTLASDEWFTSTVPDADKDFLLNVHSVWIFELAELESHTGKRDAGRLKNLITSAVDRFRMPYGRTAEPHKRSSVFCATVNEDTFLRDETGNRRYWVVPIDGSEPLDRDGLKAARDGIWKAALHAWRTGELPMLTRAQEALSELQNAEYVQTDPWLTMLQGDIDNNPKRWQTTFSTAQALQWPGLKSPEQITRADETRIAPLLRQLGFQKTKQQRIEGQRVRLWEKSNPFNPSQPSQRVTTPVASGCDAPVQLGWNGSEQPSQPSQPKSVDQMAGEQLESGGQKEAKKVVTCDTISQKACAAVGLPRHNRLERGCDSTRGCDTIPPDLLPRLLELRREHPNAAPATLALMLDPKGTGKPTGKTVKCWLDVLDQQND